MTNFIYRPFIGKGIEEPPIFQKQIRKFELMWLKEEKQPVQLKEQVLIKPFARKKDGQGKMVLAQWRDLLLRQDVQEGIDNCKFQFPSQIQYRAIPIITRSARKDFLCQAKSGTGKTNVFLISLLEMLAMDEKGEYIPHQAVIVVNTRELAHQINLALLQLTAIYKKKLGVPQLNIGVFFGGLSVYDNIATIRSSKSPHIIIGTLGRLRHLFEQQIKTQNVKFFIVDECDSLMSQKDSRDDLKYLLKKTPEDKQIMMFSATLTPEVKKICLSLMKPETAVLEMEDNQDIRLATLDHYYVKLEEEEKFDRLCVLLDNFPFDQAVVFVNTVERAKNLTSMLQSALFHPICIHSSMLQEDRLEAFDQFKRNSFRFMVATDVIGRGMDVEHLNVVFNYDFPREAETYIHRAGRAGRFGKRGRCISFVTSSFHQKMIKNDTAVMGEASQRYNFTFQALPVAINRFDF